MQIAKHEARYAVYQFCWRIKALKGMPKDLLPKVDNIAGELLDRIDRDTLLRPLTVISDVQMGAKQALRVL